MNRDESGHRRKIKGLSGYVRGTERAVGGLCDRVAPNGASHTRLTQINVQAVDEGVVDAEDREIT